MGVEMGRTLYRDIVIRGVTYATAAQAGRALGVQRQTVVKAIQAGTLDRVGLGQPGLEPCPVRVNGVVYPGARAAGKALGFKPGAIYQALKQGREDRVGKPLRNVARARPVRIGPLQFDSMAEASRALGFCVSYVSEALRRGRPVMAERLLAAAMRLQAQRERGAGAWQK
jgi:hypothetical protein